MFDDCINRQKFENSILIMADKRITYRGTLELHDDEKKIIMLNEKVVFAYAGVKNIIDVGLAKLKEFSLATNSLKEIISESQKLFSAALDQFIIPNRIMQRFIFCQGLKITVQHLFITFLLMIFSKKGSS